MLQKLPLIHTGVLSGTLQLYKQKSIGRGGGFPECKPRIHHIQVSERPDTVGSANSVSSALHFVSAVSSKATGQSVWGRARRKENPSTFIGCRPWDPSVHERDSDQGAKHRGRTPASTRPLQKLLHHGPVPFFPRHLIRPSLLPQASTFLQPPTSLLWLPQRLSLAKRCVFVGRVIHTESGPRTNLYFRSRRTTMRTLSGSLSTPRSMT